MRFTFLLAGVLGFAVGVVWRTFMFVPLPTILFVVLLAFGLAVVRRRKSEAFSPPHLVLLIIFLIFTTFGVLRTEVASWQFDSSLLEAKVGEEVSLVGVIVREPDYREATVHLSIKTDNDLVLVTADRLGQYSYGDKVVVSGRLTKPESFETDLGRTFNYPGYLRAKGIEYQVSFADVVVKSGGHGNALITALLSLKQQFITSIQKIIPEPEVGLATGLLLGVKSALGEEIEEDFRQTGIIHIVVLSGYNVMLVVTFIMFCFSFFLSLRARVVAGVLAIIAFALIVGLSATVVRASIMAVLVLIAQMLGRTYDVLRALFVAGFFMVLINPYLLIYDIGFQLSFMATLGLLLFAPQLEMLGLQRKRWFGVQEFFLATLATQIAVLPLLMYHIGEVSLIALVVNVLVLPVVPAAMLCTFVAGLLAFVSIPLGSLVGFVGNLTLMYILVVAGWFAELPFAAVTVPAFSAVGVLVLYGSMCAIWYYWYRRKQVQNDTYSDWTIETESAGEPVGSPADSSAVPIFFR